MHMSSSFAVILCIALINQYVYCSPKRDDRWWRNITRLEARQKNQWTTIDNKTVPVSAQTTYRTVKQSKILLGDDITDSPFQSRSRNWEKSYARRRDFDRTWSDDKPLRERFTETEWDDDVPVRHIFRDTSSAADEGVTRRGLGDEGQRDKSRQWIRENWNNNNNNNNNGDYSRSRSTMKDVFTSARNIDNKSNINKNFSNKPKAVSNSGQQPKTDRVLSLNFQDPDAKKKDRERLDKLAKQIFSMDNEGKEVVQEGPRTTGNRNSNGNGYGNGYVSNAVNSFTRNSGNNFATNSGNSGNNFATNSGNNGIIRNAVNTNTNTNNNNNNNKQNLNKFSNDLVKPSKPKFNVMFETSSAKPDRISSTVKLNADIRGVAEKPKTSTTPSSAQRFGWRSSINHSNDQKSKNQKIQDSSEESDDNSSADNEDVDDFEDDFEDDSTTTQPTTRVTTRAPTRTSTRSMIRTTARPTTRPIDYTTYRFTDTTRPQTITTTANKADNRETTYQTTSRPKLIAPKTNDLNNNLAPNKKQHRMGSWVDSDSLDYEEGDSEDWTDANVNNRAQPLVEDEFGSVEQLPERVEEEAGVAPLEPQAFARQSAGDDNDDQPGWRLEDALPGVPGQDYPTFATIPRTNFDCRTHEWPGYYADVETQCQVFHICQTGGRKNSFLCPNGTMFNQVVFVCDWWHNVQCGDSPTHYGLNENIYDHNWESKRISNTDSVKRSGSFGGSAEPLIATTTEPTDSDTDSTEPNNSMDSNDNSDNSNDGSNDFSNEENEDITRRASRDRSPIRIYRTSRIITAQDRQKRRRRKRGYLKV